MKLLFLSALTGFLFAGCELPETTAQAAGTEPAATETNSAPPAPTRSVLIPPTLPPNLPDAAREVVNLAHNQMGDGILTNFIANLKEPFHLDADQIVYLRDLGINPPVIEALLIRQQQLDAAPAPKDQLEVARTERAPAPSTAASAAVNSPTVYPGSTPNLPSPSVSPAETVTPAPPASTEAQPAVTNYNYFYDSLAPYGSWVTVPTYGYVWQPSCAVVTPGWRPYWNNGGWAWSDCGWYWNSYYSWGWAPFHYGNWCNAPGYGWCWAPGSTWAPSWVTFRYSSGYCGWAPLPPGCGWQSGVGLTWAGAGVGVNFSFGYGAANYCWTPTGYFSAANCWNHGVTGPRVEQIYKDSTVINNYIVGNNNTIINNGIDPAHVQKYGRSEVRKVELADVNSPAAATGLSAALARPGQSGKLPVYRPAITPGTSGNSSSSGESFRSEARPAQLASNSGSTADRFRLPPRTTTQSAPPANSAARISIPAGSPNPRGSAVELQEGGASSAPRTGSSIPNRSEVAPVPRTPSTGSPIIPSRVNPAASTPAPRPIASTYTGQPSVPSGGYSRLEPRKPVESAVNSPSGNPGQAATAPNYAQQNIRGYGYSSPANPSGAAPRTTMPNRPSAPTYQGPAFSRPQGVPSSVSMPSRPAMSTPSYSGAPRGSSPSYGGGGGGSSGGNSGSYGRPGSR